MEKNRIATKLKSIERKTEITINENFKNYLPKSLSLNELFFRFFVVEIVYSDGLNISLKIEDFNEIITLVRINENSMQSGLYD